MVRGGTYHGNLICKLKQLQIPHAFFRVFTNQKKPSKNGAWRQVPKHIENKNHLQQKRVLINIKTLFKYYNRLGEDFYFTASITALKASG
ncbi:hypothetical protein DHW03_04535 [Pedobacter yonginense]|uniref:Uncharacterized protein n=1 Tax=Pedobacter yonginense TaxID=651869 RepID=A0A317EQD6_9SPHI|nr:hypothetical protein DHW03_04535 [Pedobacter yonginense]